MQLCAHCLALTVPVSVACSLDPASDFRRCMREVLGVSSIVGMYARPRDYYVALFASNTLDDESLTVHLP